MVMSLPPLFLLHPILFLLPVPCCDSMLIIKWFLCNSMEMSLEFMGFGLYLQVTLDMRNHHLYFPFAMTTTS